MVVLTADVVQTRLLDIKNPTQEAIETMSLWIMHYKDKASIDLIVDGWLSCFKIGTDNKRIALFYVMNDVVQKAKIKHSDMLVPAFQPAVLTAVGIGRKQDKVKSVMKRCIQIFKSRNVFSPNSITAMENLLDSEEGVDAEDQALEVDTDELIGKITKFVEARNIIADMMKCVNDADFDYKEKCRSGMKDREEGAHILQEVHEAIDTMVQVRHSMEDHKKKMIALSETLELAKRLFLHQKREVLVVEEAYVNFRDGIKAVHTELLEMEEKGNYPGILSPSGGDDDHLGSSNEDGYRQPGITSWGDNRAPVDMEIDDEEPQRAAAPALKASLQNLIGIASQPSLQSRIMQLGLKKIADGDETMLQQAAATTPVPVIKAPPSTDFSRPPPGVGAFGAPNTAIPVVKMPLDPRKRQEENSSGLSQYTLTLQQHGMLPPATSVPPPTQPVYTAQFEARDPRTAPLPAPVTSPISAYRGQFEPARPQQPPAAPGYQASFDVAPPPKPTLISPQPGAFQSRFEPANANHQQPAQPPYQQQGGFKNYGGFGAPKDTDSRFDRGGAGGGGYQRNHYDDRRNNTPYSNPRGGGDRWRGGFNDRGRGNRDNWRGGGRGGYNRY